MNLTIYAPYLGMLGLIIAWFLYSFVKKQPTGNKLMTEISETIHRGAMVFLKKEYSVISVFIIVVFGLLYWQLGWQTAIAFLTGAVCSMLAGYFGMNSATRANVRTTQAAKD